MVINQTSSLLLSGGCKRNAQQIFRHKELTEQQKEFKIMAIELRNGMNKTDSALGLFLKVKDKLGCR